ncbi:MAG: sugar ABC transporter permease, partial [Kutzneria sp.]|nr:sugar ABC transporter permease [Kutzneria sp.]
MTRHASPPSTAAPPVEPVPGAESGTGSRSYLRRLGGRELPLAVVFLAPAVLGLGLFVIFPLFQAVFLATRGSDIIGSPTRYVGLRHFAELLTPEFGQVLWHTLAFTLIVVVAGVLLPLALAVPLSQRLPGMRVFRSLFT